MYIFVQRDEVKGQMYEKIGKSRHLHKLDVENSFKVYH